MTDTVAPNAAFPPANVGGSNVFRTTVGTCIACALMVGIAYAVVRFGSVANALSARSAVPMFMVAAVADLTTAIVLLTVCYSRTLDRGIVVLGLAAGGTALLAFIAACGIPLWIGGPAIVPSARQAVPWLYCFDDAGLGVAAFVYAALRVRTADSNGSSRFFVYRSGLSVAAFVVAAGLAAFGLGAHLPHLLSGASSLTALRTIGAGPIALLLCAAGAWRIMRVRPLTEIDRAFALALFAFVLQMAMNLAAPDRSTAVWFFSRSFMCFGSLVILVASIRLLSSSRGPAVRSEDEAMRHAEQIRSLYGIASSATSSEDVSMRWILQTAAATIRPGRAMCGLCCHLDGETLNVDAVAWAGPPHPASETSVLHAGAVMALERTLFAHVLPIARTMVWDDLAVAATEGLICHELGWRSMIVTPVVLDGRTYVLIFGSLAPMTEEPFAQDDIAYVEVLAAFIADCSLQHRPSTPAPPAIEHRAFVGPQNRRRSDAALPHVEGADLSRELAEAIARDDLAIVYQPTFELHTGMMTGAEALLRWWHRSRGPLLPKDIIACAERDGLMGRLARWVMLRVIDDVGKLGPLPDGFRCYFNLAPSQIGDAAFLGSLESRLSDCAAMAEHLGIEITESAVIRDVAHATNALDRFRQLGIRVAVDDFGTGFSSLSYLKRLPVDMIKLDQSFVSGLPEDERDAALCELLLNIAKRFGFATLAEGVETPAQRDWLAAHGCDYGQGYFLARPIPYYAFVALVRSQAGKPMPNLTRQ